MKYTLDEFLQVMKIATPNYMKIDVDGSEYQVLSGMRQTLGDRNLQKIFIELEEQGENFNVCNAVLVNHGFQIESRKRVQNYFGEENMVYAR